MKKDRGSLAGLKPRSLETYVSSALGHPIHRYYTIHLGFVKPKNETIGGSLSLRDLMPSYNPGLATGGVTKPPDLLEI